MKPTRGKLEDFVIWNIILGNLTKVRTAEFFDMSLINFMNYFGERINRKKMKVQIVKSEKGYAIRTDDGEYLSLKENPNSKHSFEFIWGEKEDIEERFGLIKSYNTEDQITVIKEIEVNGEEFREIYLKD